MDELPFGLARKETFAALTPADLEFMGKRASNMYLGEGVTLNDAICKLAKEHPSISTHQVRRIVEFANTETFQRLFEKQAGDRNVEFPVADPSVILHGLEAPVTSAVMSATPSDYGRDPIKLASKNLESDLLLCQAFGITPETPSLEGSVEKTAATVSDDEAIEIAKEVGVDLSEFPLDQFRRGIEVEMEHDSPSDPRADVIKGDDHAAKVQAGRIALAHLKEDKTYYTKLDKMEKEGQLLKTAMAYVKSGRPFSQRVAEDLAYGVSTDKIKEKTAQIGQYAEANPFGELLRTRQTVERAFEEAVDGCEKNAQLVKEAIGQLEHEVTQHVLGGGNLAEVVTALSGVNADTELMEVALSKVAATLLRKGLNGSQLQVDSIIHDMAKQAGSIPNPDHPMVQAYAALVKLADGGVTLQEARDQLEGTLREINGVLKEAMVQHASSMQ